MKRDSKEEALQVRRDARMIPFGLFSPGSGGGEEVKPFVRGFRVAPFTVLVSYRGVLSNEGIHS